MQRKQKSRKWWDSSSERSSKKNLAGLGGGAAWRAPLPLQRGIGEGDPPEKPGSGSPAPIGEPPEGGGRGRGFPTMATLGFEVRFLLLLRRLLSSGFGERGGVARF